MPNESLFWEDVREGDPLPAFQFELSLLRLIAFARASGLYDYVHIDRDYAQAAGARDAFISTPHVAGLFGRLVTDWSGPGADIRSLAFAMRTQSCAGDMLTVEGKIGRKHRGADGAYLVDLVGLTIGHALARQAAVGTATMVLPSRAGGPVPPPRPGRAGEPPVSAAGVPDFAKPFIGQSRPGGGLPARPLTTDDIHLWCEALEDWNPLYWDDAYAASSRYRGIIAPATGMFLGAGSAVGLGIGHGKPGTAVPDGIRQGLTGLALQQSLRKQWAASGTLVTPPDCPEIAVVQAISRYFVPLRPGDTAHTEVRLMNCSEKKATKLGEGYFLTAERLIFNQRKELVRTFELTTLYYRV